MVVVFAMCSFSDRQARVIDSWGLCAQSEHVETLIEKIKGLFLSVFASLIRRCDFENDRVSLNIFTLAKPPPFRHPVVQ